MINTHNSFPHYVPYNQYNASCVKMLNPIKRSNPNAILHIPGPLTDIDANLVHLLVLFVEYIPLQLQVLELFVLLLILISKDIGEPRRPFGELPQHLVVIFMCFLVQFFEVELQLALHFLLLVDASLEMVDGRLHRKWGTSMLSTCSLTVVVTPSLSLLRVPVRLMAKSKFPVEFMDIYL